MAAAIADPGQAARVGLLRLVDGELRRLEVSVSGGPLGAGLMPL